MPGKGWEEVRVGFRVILYIYIVWDTLAGSLEFLQRVLVNPYVHPAALCIETGE